MDSTLTRLIRALRAAGAPVSSAEAIDAARAMALVGYAERESLKASLAVTLAKSEEEKVLFDTVFDQLFSPPVGVAALAAATPASDLPPTGLAHLDALLSHPEQLQWALVQAAQAVELDDIRFASQTAYYNGRLMEELGIGPLDARLQTLLTAGGEGGGDLQREAQAQAPRATGCSALPVRWSASVSPCLARRPPTHS